VWDGEPVRDPARDVDGTNSVAVDGCALAGAERRVVYAVNKPLGVVSGRAGHQRSPDVVSARAHVWAAPVSDWTPGRRQQRPDPAQRTMASSPNRLTHHVFRSQVLPRACGWRARAGGRFCGPASRRGADDGLTAPARARRVSKDLIELTITEGRNRPGATHDARRLVTRCWHWSECASERCGWRAWGRGRTGVERAGARAVAHRR